MSAGESSYDKIYQINLQHLCALLQRTPASSLSRYEEVILGFQTMLQDSSRESVMEGEEKYVKFANEVRCSNRLYRAIASIQMLRNALNKKCIISICGATNQGKSTFFNRSLGTNFPAGANPEASTNDFIPCVLVPGVTLVDNVGYTELSELRNFISQQLVKVSSSVFVVCELSRELITSPTKINKSLDVIKLLEHSEHVKIVLVLSRADVFYQQITDEVEMAPVMSPIASEDPLAVVPPLEFHTCAADIMAFGDYNKKVSVVLCTTLGPRKCIPRTYLSSFDTATLEESPPFSDVNPEQFNPNALATFKVYSRRGVLCFVKGFVFSIIPDSIDTTDLNKLDSQAKRREYASSVMPPP
jgi:hypothetical protein